MGLFGHVSTEELRTVLEDFAKGIDFTHAEILQEHLKLKDDLKNENKARDKAIRNLDRQHQELVKNLSELSGKVDQLVRDLTANPVYQKMDAMCQRLFFEAHKLTEDVGKVSSKINGFERTMTSAQSNITKLERLLKDFDNIEGKLDGHKHGLIHLDNLFSELSNRSEKLKAIEETLVSVDPLQRFTSFSQRLKWLLFGTLPRVHSVGSSLEDKL